MKQEASPARQALILICKKCGSRLATDDGNPSKHFAKSLKSEIKEASLKGDVRVSLTDCLDICPKGRIVASVFRTDGAKPKFLSFSENDLENSTGPLLDKLLDL